MAEGDVPQGRRFSHVYLQRPDQLEDSERMRRRLGSLYSHIGKMGSSGFLFGELGLPSKTVITQGDWMLALLKFDLADVLDSITIFYSYLVRMAGSRDVSDARWGKENALRLLLEIRRIFAEEQVRYRVDNAGGVHLAVDQQFEVAKAATVQGMSDPRYAEALRLLEGGYKALDGVPPDGKEAVRGVFGAAENLFLLTFGTAKINRLTGPFIDQNLKPAVAALPWGQEGKAAGEAMVDALKNWATASHKYRHEASHPDPHQPPFDLAILMVTQGTGFVRWLVTIDKAVMAAAAAPAP